MRLSEAFELLIIFSIIAAVVAVVWLGYFVIARMRHQPVWPTIPSMSNTWNGFDVIGIWFVMVVLQLIGTSIEKTGMIAAVVGITIFIYWKKFSQAESNREPRSTLRDLMFGVPMWLLFAPLTHLVFVGTLVVIESIGGKIEEHPLANLPSDNMSDVIRFVISACLVAPILEELAFRRVLVPWAMLERYRSWCVIAFAGLFAVSRIDSTEPRFDPLWFYLVLAMFGAVVSRVGQKWHFAVYASAVLFAMVHVQVWPSPIPLFVLGIGLGYTIALTGSVWPCIVVHALFNLISSVWVLRQA